MNIFTSNTRYLPYIQIFSTLAVILFCILVPQSLSFWLVSFGMYALIGCFGISIGYHRYLTHKSFKLNKFWEKLCTIFGMLAFTGSSIGWVGVHRQHHRYTDKPGDPHSPAQNGLKMLVASYQFDPNMWTIRSLITDKFHLFTHKYYFLLLLAWAGFWALISISLVFYIVVIPAVLSVWSSTISNYTNHKWGYKNFEIADNSTNNWINAIFTFGEGWHNNHHAKPGSYTFKVKWWEFDPAASIVELIRS